MDLIQIVTLALVQGLTEFLPVSSSAHLILIPYLFNWTDQGLAFDVAVHLGTLAAVVIYFRRKVAAILRDLFTKSGLGRTAPTVHTRLGWMIVLASIPVAVSGLLMNRLVETELRSPLVIAATTAGFGVLLWIFDVKGKRMRDEYSIGWRDAFIIGLFQAVAIIPGTSRSGITITAGLMLGLSRQAASRFSFLASIPAIFMSGVLVTINLIRSGNTVNWSPLLLGMVFSFIAAYLCIHYFLKFIERIGMLPFALYRGALAAFILVAVLL